MVLSNSERNRRWILTAVAFGCTALAGPLIAQTPLADLCGCRHHPESLGAFDTRDRNTWPPGTTQNPSNLRQLTIPLPADGVLVFDSLHVEHSQAIHGFFAPVEIRFVRNAINTPVTILVKGNAHLTGTGMIIVGGAAGTNATSNAAGTGGLGGPGGFRGGDGAFRAGNFVSDGGAGLGPGGGLGATVTPLAAAGNATFIGATDLLPLVGGSGGGGGRSSTTSTLCSAGGGGGGGGGILLVANGTVTISNGSGSIVADGGEGGGAVNPPCATGGGGGSGGAIRIVANTLQGGGRLLARGGHRWEDNAVAPSGMIRLEAAINTFGVTLTDPIASRSPTPGPVVNPFSASVALTSVGGQPVPAIPQGGYGTIDIQIPAPGPTAIDLATEGVPEGTIVLVRVKPRVGGPPISQNVTLQNCDGAGRCLASATFDLAAGTYSIEARATFESQ